MPAQAIIPAVSSQPVNVTFDGNQTAIAALTDSTSGTATGAVATCTRTDSTSGTSTGALAACTLTDNSAGTPAASVEDVTGTPSQTIINANFASVVAKLAVANSNVARLAADLATANDNFARLTAKVNALAAMLTTLGLTE